MNETALSLPRADYDHIPAHIRIDGSLKYHPAKRRGGKQAGSGRKPGSPNKGREAKENIIVYKDNAMIGKMTYQDAAKASGRTGKSVLYYARVGKIDENGYRFERAQ